MPNVILIIADQQRSDTIDFRPGGDDQQKNVAEYIRGQLKKIGIAVDVRASADFPSWAKRMAAHDFDMSMDLVFNWGDPIIGVHRTYLSGDQGARQSAGVALGPDVSVRRCSFRH